MNNDEFEQKLQALTAALHRPDPTPGWKAEILARARREANVIPLRRTLPPRWLMLSWAAAWVAILGLELSAPHDPALPAGREMAAAPAQTSDPSSPTLLAFHQQMNLNLDLAQ
jgi:hypothetical protein